MNPGAEHLSVHFLTIVLNGEPFIRYHYQILENLPFRWHWHVVEGAAELRHDTAWACAYGGALPDRFHTDGLSNDGTSEYLDRLRECDPCRVSVYRPPTGRLWDGKLEMVNAPLAAITEDCLLWQLDVDEFWTVSQIVKTRQLFLNHPEKTAALFSCHFFITPDLVVIDDISSQHRLSENWLRVWRYSQDCRWKAHEPPILEKILEDGSVVNIGQKNPFSCQETSQEGLIFQHKAYVLKSQLQFKEQYYGYKGITMNWLMLQKQADFPVMLKPFFPWPFIGEGTTAVPQSFLGITNIDLPETKEQFCMVPRDFSHLNAFLEKIEADIYPQEPSFSHSDITSKGLDLLEKMFPLWAGMKVLDVGCGQGPALEFFRAKNTDYLGITLDEEDIAACRSQGFNVAKMDQSFLTMADQSQDLIWARHVVEHSVFPLFTLHGFNRVLRPGGMLYLEVPAPETSCHHERNPNHYSVFSKGSWRSLLERSGFKVLGDVDYSFEVPAGPDVYWGFYCLK